MNRAAQMNGVSPAHPNPESADLGLTKRESFAMAALQGIASRLDAVTGTVDDLAGGIRGGRTAARAAIVLADALLDELERR